MGLFDAILLRLILWLSLIALLVAVAVGPGRVSRWLKRFQHWLRERRQDPEQILAEIVRQHSKHISALRQALSQAESAEADIIRNTQKSEENMPALEQEARRMAAHGDDLGARAALYKLNLERVAIANFKEQLERQKRHIAESRRRLYLLELQLRQFEVGRSILLSQLAEAKTVEQQYAIAKDFDPFSAVANWEKAEGLVQEKAITARAAERVHADTSDLTARGPAQVDPSLLDVQLADLKASLEGNNSVKHLDAPRPQPADKIPDEHRQRLKPPEN
jgi:phage shock protein A